MSRTVKAQAPRVVTADDLCAAATYRVMALGSWAYANKPLPAEWQVPQATLAELREDFARRFPRAMQNAKTTKRGGAND